MATLADSFLQDLADLNNEDEEETFIKSEEQSKADSAKQNNSRQKETVINDNNNKVNYLESELLVNESFLELIETLRQKSEESPLTASETEIEVKKDKSKASNETAPLYDKEAIAAAEALAEQEENKFIRQANESIAKIDIEILNIYSFIRDIYAHKFPELESIVVSPLEYISVVSRIKNETDLTLIDLNDILPNTVVMAITVASSMTTGSLLPENDVDRISHAAANALALANHRKTVLSFLESRMEYIAPNVSAIIGSALTARLITHVGSIVNLARMPAQNILNIGLQNSFNKYNTGSNLPKSTLNPIVGGSITTMTNLSASIIYNCDIVQMTPFNKRNRALKLVAGKIGLASRVDSFHEAPTGEIGVMLRQQILRSLLKIQEPSPAPLKKALPIPDDAPKPRRGGKRHRRAKAKYGLSELRKEANRLIFGPEAEDEVDQEGRMGLGAITSSLGHGRLRLQAKQMKLATAAAKRRRGLLNRAGATEASEGLSSSVVFTPVQGIELCNPSAPRSSSTTADTEYFNVNTGFDKFV